MIENNNSRIITKLAGRAVHSNKRRNLILVMAVMLSTFMIVSVLTAGAAYFESQNKQNMRMSGAKYDAVLLGGVKEEQLEQCEKDKNIKSAGCIIQCGYPNSNGEDKSLHTRFIWCDDTYWDIQKKPALEEIKGSRPVKENELMMSDSAVKECVGEDGRVGSEFTLTYDDSLGTHTKEFIISGIYKDYENSQKAFVSEAFYKTTGYKLSDINAGRMYVEFKQPFLTEKQQNQLVESLELDKQQRFFFNSEVEYSLLILTGVAALILITFLSAYLLIYNILYLSVSSDIRHYGLLGTIGMTSRQIRCMLRRQMLLLGGAGTAAGLILGSGAAFAVIPGLIKQLGVRGQDVSVFFHPGVYIAAVLLAAVTVWAGSKRPVRIAGDISPIEAAGYTVRKVKRKTKKKRKGGLSFRMAAEQLAKDKRKSAMVILSLSVSVAVFMCIVTLIQSQGARTIASAYNNYDMIIENDTMTREDSADYAHVFDKAFLSKVENIDGIKKIHKVYQSEIVVPWEEDLADTWMEEFYATWMTYPYADGIEEYKQNPDKFYSFAAGIDEEEFDDLSKDLKTSVNKEAFLKGEVCIIYRNDLELSDDDLRGKTLSFYLKGQDGSNLHTIETAAFTDDSHAFNTWGMVPSIIVSDRFLKEIAGNPYIGQLGILYEEEYDESCEQQINSCIEESPYVKDLETFSKSENMKKIKKSQGNMMGIGMAVVFVLALIGIMNYINTIAGNTQSRMKELSILESVGMTRRQIRGMFIWEGILYAGISLILASTVGTAVTYAVYEAMNYMKVPFAMPVSWLLPAYILVAGICIAIPLIAYRILAGDKSVVDRLREREI